MLKFQRIRSAASLPVFYSLLAIAISLITLVPISMPAALAVESSSTDGVTQTPLFLPISSEKFEDFLWQLPNDLAHQGISNIEIRTADHWHAFQQGLRSGHYGVYFAPPHFAAWAISHHGFIPLARLLEPLSYVIAAPRNEASIFEINDLANMQICATRPLNLDYLLVNSAFDNRLLSANVRIVNTPEQEMIRSKSQCDGFSVGNHVFERLTKSQPDRFIRLQQSAKYNNLVLLAHPDVDVDMRNELMSYFLSNSAQEKLKPMLKLFANDTILVKSRRDDYPEQYMNELLTYWSASNRNK